MSYQLLPHKDGAFKVIDDSGDVGAHIRKVGDEWGIFMPWAGNSRLVDETYFTKEAAFARYESYMLNGKRWG